MTVKRYSHVNNILSKVKLVINWETFIQLYRRLHTAVLCIHEKKVQQLNSKMRKLPQWTMQSKINKISCKYVKDAQPHS